MFFSDFFYISDDYTFSFRKCLVPPVYDIHIDILQFINLRNYPISTPFISIIGSMSFIAILENIYPVRTDMFTKKANKFIYLFIRCIIIKC